MTSKAELRERLEKRQVMAILGMGNMIPISIEERKEIIAKIDADAVIIAEKDDLIEVYKKSLHQFGYVLWEEIDGLVLQCEYCGFPQEEQHADGCTNSVGNLRELIAEGREIVKSANEMIRANTKLFGLSPDAETELDLQTAWLEKVTK